jgi:hypothetical protein
MTFFINPIVQTRITNTNTHGYSSDGDCFLRTPFLLTTTTRNPCAVPLLNDRMRPEDVFINFCKESASEAAHENAQTDNFLVTVWQPLFTQI